MIYKCKIKIILIEDYNNLGMSKFFRNKKEINSDEALRILHCKVPYKVIYKYYDNMTSYENIKEKNANNWNGRVYESFIK